VTRSADPGVRSRPTSTHLATCSPQISA
jgi:hypothetical protein